MFVLSNVNSASKHAHANFVTPGGTTYTAGDMVSANTSGSANLLTFNNICNRVGGSAILYNAVIITDEAAAATPNFSLLIFTQNTFAYINDSPLTFTFTGAAISPEPIAVVNFTSRARLSTGTSPYIYQGIFNNPLSITAGTARDGIFGMLITTNGYTAAAAAQFRIEIQVLQMQQ
jgi:hypothetical protein